MALVQKFIVEDAAKASSLLPQHVALVTPDGQPFKAAAEAPAVTADTLSGVGDTGKAVLKAANQKAARDAIGAGTSNFSGKYSDLTGAPPQPAKATASKEGLVKQTAAAEKVVLSHAVAAAGDAPTKAEFDAVVGLVNQCKERFNALIDAQKTSGQMA